MVSLSPYFSLFFSLVKYCRLSAALVLSAFSFIQQSIWKAVVLL